MNSRIRLGGKASNYGESMVDSSPSARDEFVVGETSRLLFRAIFAGANMNCTSASLCMWRYGPVGLSPCVVFGTNKKGEARGRGM